MSTALAVPDARILFEKMAGKNILVVGDLMLDEWIWGRVERISPEAPVPVVAVSNHSFTLGGAGNVAHNLCVLGANVSCIGVVGDDPFGNEVRAMLRAQNIDADGVISVDDRPTTRKTRIVAQHQQVVRADWESVEPLRAADAERIVGIVAAAAKRADAVIVSDYAKGLLTREIVEAANLSPLVLGDPKPQHAALFSGVTCVAPNLGEAAAASGIAIRDDASLERAGKILLERFGCRYVVVTRGEHGMALFGRDGERLAIPSVARTVFDVSGAGDTVVSVLALALSVGASIDRAMQLANYAAGAVVEKLGTATANAEEILELLEHADA
ncbi:MAG: D-glycero-beta-D-manno-heptose-7-phosphate kinase [Candidatus Eremiobacteraeota bacterium]|nr:D-glycero-beta-D-manno-heptose-7-phosphate kinase [Candidatus Eremiobacteraeota bacterium]